MLWRKAAAADVRGDLSKVSDRSRPAHPTKPMSPTPSSHVDDHEPGQLLYELEQRQDEALRELEKLEARLHDVLTGLGVSIDDPAVPV